MPCLTVNRRCLPVLWILMLGAGHAHAQADRPPNKDPLEGFNRAVFGFNDALDRVLLTPLAMTTWRGRMRRSVPSARFSVTSQHCAASSQVPAVSSVPVQALISIASA